jgi:hypothetical protein
MTEAEATELEQHADGLESWLNDLYNESDDEKLVERVEGESEHARAMADAAWEVIERTELVEQFAADRDTAIAKAQRLSATYGKVTATLDAVMAAWELVGEEEEALRNAIEDLDDARSEYARLAG